MKNTVLILALIICAGCCSQKHPDAALFFQKDALDCQSAFVAAAEDGNVEVVKFFLEYDLDPNKDNKDEWLPLVSASHSNSYPTIELLLKNGADVNKMDIRGYTPLVGVITSIGTALDEESNSNIIKLLLDSGADVSIPYSSRTPLIWAGHYGHNGAIKLLLKHKANINKTDDKGNSALMEACFRRNPDSVAILLEHGADPDIINNNCETALDLAPQLDRTAVVQKLERTKRIISLLRSKGGKTAKELNRKPTNKGAM